MLSFVGMQRPEWLEACAQGNQKDWNLLEARYLVWVHSCSCLPSFVVKCSCFLSGLVHFFLCHMAALIKCYGRIYIVLFFRGQLFLEDQDYQSNFGYFFCIILVTTFIIDLLLLYSFANSCRSF